MDGKGSAPHEADKFDPAPRQDFATKQAFAHALWHKVVLEFQSPADVWLEVSPTTSVASKEGAQRQARRWLRWYRLRFPRQIAAAVQEHEKAMDAQQEAAARPSGDLKDMERDLPRHLKLRQKFGLPPVFAGRLGVASSRGDRR